MARIIIFLEQLLSPQSSASQFPKQQNPNSLHLHVLFGEGNGNPLQ